MTIENINSKIDRYFKLYYDPNNKEQAFYELINFIGISFSEYCKLCDEGLIDEELINLILS